MDEVNQEMVDLELWDHYSGLPNPSWYQYLENQKGNEIEIINKENK